MSFIVERQPRQPQLPEGWHKAVTKEVLEERAIATRFGMKDAANFVFEADGIEIKQRFWIPQNFSKKSKLYQLIKDLTASEPGNKFDLETLVGLACEIDVRHRKTDSGDVYESVVAARRVE